MHSFQDNNKITQVLKSREKELQFSLKLNATTSAFSQDRLLNFLITSEIENHLVLLNFLKSNNLLG
jgi:hypothetical protein